MSSLRGKKTMSFFVMSVTHCHTHNDPGTLSRNLTALQRHSQCPRASSRRPRLIFNMKSNLILPNSLECNHLKACHESRTPSLLLPPLELQAIRSCFRQEVWNAQQNLIRQTGLWQRTQGEHPTSINNVVESLMTRQGTHIEILKHGIPACRPLRSSSSRVFNLMLLQGGREKILPTESVPLISSFISGIIFCIIYIDGLLS